MISSISNLRLFHGSHFWPMESPRREPLGVAKKVQGQGSVRPRVLDRVRVQATLGAHPAGHSSDDEPGRRHRCVSACSWHMPMLKHTIDLKLLARLLPRAGFIGCISTVSHLDGVRSRRVRPNLHISSYSILIILVLPVIVMLASHECRNEDPRLFSRPTS